MYKIKIHKRVPQQAHDEGITPSEFNLLIDVLCDLAKQDDPKRDWRVKNIRCTGGEWQRVKCRPETWRGIIEIQESEHVIILQMVLRRDQYTYSDVNKVWFVEGVA